MSRQPPAWYVERVLGTARLYNSLPPESERQVKLPRRLSFAPGGRWKVSLTARETGPDTWSISRLDVYRRGRPNRWLAKFYVNYSSPFIGWVMDHHGHDYLLTCEDYQGIDVFELDTGQGVAWAGREKVKVTNLDGEEVEILEEGFCHRSLFQVDPNDPDRLFAQGCYWASPDEWRLYDIRRIMDLPWPILSRGWSGYDELSGRYSGLLDMDGKPVDLGWQPKVGGDGR